MQDPEWVEMQREWDFLFKVKMPGIRIVKPQGPNVPTSPTEAPVERGQRKGGVHHVDKLISYLSTELQPVPSKLVSPSPDGPGDVFVERIHEVTSDESDDGLRIRTDGLDDSVSSSEGSSHQSSSSGISRSSHRSGGGDIVITEIERPTDSPPEIISHDSSPPENASNEDERTTVNGDQQAAAKHPRSAENESHPESSRLQSREESFPMPNVTLGDQILHHQRARRIYRIFTQAAMHMVYTARLKPALRKGIPLTKLQDRKPGKVSECLVGVDSASLWWSHRGSRSHVPLSDIVRIEYGAESNCIANLLTRFGKKSPQNLILPWNCFTVVTRARCIDFYAPDRKDSGGQSLYDNMSSDVEAFILGFSRFLKEEKQHHVPGTVPSLGRMKLVRAVMKLAFLKRSGLNLYIAFLRQLEATNSEEDASN